MERIVKCPKRQDCHYKLTPGTSNETSINISNEVFKFIMPKGVPSGTTVDVSFTVYKDDFVKALCHLVTRLPLYKTASGQSAEVKYTDDFFVSQYDAINSFFGQNETEVYNVKLFNRDDGRIYLNDLNDRGLNVRKFLVESNSVLVFNKENDTLFLRVESGADIFERYSRTIGETEPGSIVVADKTLALFIMKCVKVLSEIDGLNSLIPFIANPIISGNPIKIASPDDDFALTGMFLETTADNLFERNAERTRWFTDEFSLDGHTVYLSTQWNGRGSYQLTLQDFIKMVDVCYPGRFVYSMEGDHHTLRSTHPQILSLPQQTIFFGTPGSGKSHLVKGIVDDHPLKTFRTTFHPDSDYASFVGSYKPVKEGDDLTYEFVPQVFTDAYVAAWNDTSKPVYLVIEEINRGNCAQIFGDLFQLLDRGDDGKSEYRIKADRDLRKYLESDRGLGEGHEGIDKGELCLPKNLSIYATMNTSDQSLFPMDSAFKRRWEWEYVPIDPDNPKSQFIITIEDKKYRWKDFLIAANERIKEVSESEDKQMGNFFIKSDIGKDAFISKVMFYLWSEVCKEEYHARSFFHFKDGTNDEFSFNELFQKDDNGDNKDVALLQGFMKYLKVDEIEPEVDETAL